jgi:hypothetical protein
VNTIILSVADTAGPGEKKILLVMVETVTCVKMECVEGVTCAQINMEGPKQVYIVALILSVYQADVKVAVPCLGNVRAAHAEKVGSGRYRSDLCMD